MNFNENADVSKSKRAKTYQYIFQSLWSITSLNSFIVEHSILFSRREGDLKSHPLSTFIRNSKKVHLESLEKFILRLALLNSQFYNYENCYGWYCVNFFTLVILRMIIFWQVLGVRSYRQLILLLCWCPWNIQ